MEAPKNESKFQRSKAEYAGGPSTLCTGCGHDLITSSIISAYSDLQIDPYDIIKMSGIGCSSKTPGYFVGVAQGINSMHGRMAPVATGALTVRPDKYFIGVSGDGDTASIGLGGFCHLIRRNPRMVYIVANNGVYGLTKGQFSPTADKSALLKSGEQNHFSGIDICSLSLTLGCGFVARAYVGDQKQLVSILKSAIQFDGLAVIDVISPCITFNNHDGSQMSYTYIKTHQKILNTVDFVDRVSGDLMKTNQGLVDDMQKDRSNAAEYTVQIEDDYTIHIKKINHLDHDVSNVSSALRTLEEARAKGHVLTGLLHCQPVNRSLSDELNLESTRSLADLTEKELRPNQDEFQKLMKGYC